MKGDSAGRVVASLLNGKDTATTYTGKKINVEDLGIKHRKVEIEELVI